MSHLRHVHLFATLDCSPRLPCSSDVPPSVGEQGPRRGRGPLLLGPGFIAYCPPGRGQVHHSLSYKRAPSHEHERPGHICASACDPRCPSVVQPWVESPRFSSDVSEPLHFPQRACTCFLQLSFLFQNKGTKGALPLGEILQRALGS